MAESKSSVSLSLTTMIRRNLCAGTIVSLVVMLVMVVVILYRVDQFNPAPLPRHSLSWDHVTVPKHNSHVLDAIERIGDGLLLGPEDLAYDAQSGFIYTGCNDGWIKRVKVAELVEDMKVENWVYVGGRPLGIAIGTNKQVVVAEAFKGLLKVTGEGDVEVLTDEAEGLKFILTNGVDVAEDGIIYFTDASYKYNVMEFLWDFLEGRPHGRLMSFDPSTGTTKVLARDLYFANGVTLSQRNDFVIFCETLLRRCQKYNIKGEKKGSIETFVDNLPGYPDNIGYDGEGQYWIALPMGKTLLWDALMRYPSVRKALAIYTRFFGLPETPRYGGVIAVDLKGEVTSLHTDKALSSSSGIKIGHHLYYGSLLEPYIRRLDLNQHPANATCSSSDS